MPERKTEVQTGRVTFYDATKGYGFIRPDGGAADWFGHATGLIGETELFVGDVVTFEVEFDKRKNKDKAVGVRVLS
jgi:CspA family cold shock protein